MAIEISSRHMQHGKIRDIFKSILDEDKLYIKFVDHKKIYDFVVDGFFV